MDSVVVPLIAAVRVDTQWGSRSSLLRCLARLTRELTPRECEQMRHFPEFLVSAEDGVTYTCRPEEVEASQKRLAGALVTASTAALKPPSVLRRRPRAPARVRKTSTAAHQ